MSGEKSGTVEKGQGREALMHPLRARLLRLFAVGAVLMVLAQVFF